MASVRKKGPGWIVEVRVKGRYKSKLFDLKSDAEAWGFAKQQEFKAAAGLGLVTGRSVENAFDRYALEVSPGKKGARWELVRLKRLARDELAMILMEDIRPDDIQLWIEGRLNQVSAASVNRELNLISAVFTVAKKRWKWIANNPCAEIERPKNPPHRDRRISDVEIQRILEALGYVEDQAIETQRQVIAVGFLFAIETAMRQSEIWGLRWADVFLSANFVHLNDTKNGSKRDVPLSNRAKALLLKIKPGHRCVSDQKVFAFNQASCGVIFRRAVLLAGIHNLHFHDTRHEGLTRLSAKLDVLALAKMAGHKDPRSLMTYYNPTATELAARLN